MSKKVFYKASDGRVGDKFFWKSLGYGTDLIRKSVKTGKPCRKTKKLEPLVFYEDHREYAENHTNKGKTPWNKGKHGVYSEATLQKNREAHLGKGLIRRSLIIPEDYIALCDIPYYTRSALDRICDQEDVHIEQLFYKNQRINVIKKADLEKIKNHSYNAKGGSKWETEVQEYFSEATRNRRDVIKPLELDLYFEEQKVAVECDGLYTHNELSKPANYHKLKSDLCREKGIRLIHIFEDEWRDKRDICISLINSALGKYDRKVFARKCEKKEIDRKEVELFLEENHIQGKCQFHKAIGLFFEEELVQLIALRKNPFKKGELELARMCSKCNTQVVGGFSRLMKDVHNIFSYVDLRLFDGSGYLSSGWQVVSQSNPGYDYTDFRNRYNRMNFMKHRIKDWEGETEHEKCNNRKLYRIYNCGMLKLHKA